MAQSNEPSMSNTKKEILDAYKQIQLQLKEKEASELNPQKQLKEKKETEVVNVADALSAEGAMKEINNLKLEVNKILTQLSEKLEDSTGQYEKIKTAIDVKKADLKDVYEIEKEAHSLAALIEAQNQRRVSFQKEMEEDKQRLKEEIEQVRRQWESEKKQYMDARKEQEETEKKTREREAEEYTYEIERKKKLDTDASKDRMNQLEKELAAMREEVEKELMLKREDLQNRETQVSDREKIMNQLQLKIDTFPDEMDKAVQKAVKETTDKLTTDFTAQITLIKKESEGEKNVLESRIESLEKTISDQRSRIEKLTKQLDDSYIKVQDIAVKAIEGTKDNKVIHQLEKLIKESSRTPMKES